MRFCQLRRFQPCHKLYFATPLPNRVTKPGARKRKVAPLLPSVSDMSQLPSHMLLGPDFTAPRVKRAA